MMMEITNRVSLMVGLKVFYFLLLKYFNGIFFLLHYLLSNNSNNRLAREIGAAVYENPLARGMFDE
jgi:hypothetical protein